MSSFTGLLHNVILLLALGIIYDTLGLYRLNSRTLRDGLSGLLIGLVGMAVMLTPWELVPGIFFDTRWILLSLCGLFFGLTPTLIAVAMTVTLRLFQGGGGMYVGSLVIISTAAVGLLWRLLVQRKGWQLSWSNLYLFGLLVQLDMLSCMFLMPESVRYKILAAVAPPVLSFYPLGTMLLGLILRRQRERRAAEIALEEHRQLLDRERGLLRSLIDTIPDLIFIKDKDGTFLDLNRAFAEQMGLTPQEIVGNTDRELFDAETAAIFQQEDREILASGQPLNKDKLMRFPNGRERLMNVHKTLFRGLDGTLYGLAGIARDITERKREEEERQQLQAQLAQAQKIESVGQLAGGIAHDFNNMLAVILGQAELAQLRINNPERLQLAIEEIKNAARRSSALTQQLLAFARKQSVAPQVIDLNESVSAMYKMLRRVIGEEIKLKLILEKELWRVKIDPGQVDQLLTNLCVNARDAIEGSGQISIETGNKLLDEAWCRNHSNLQPGEYVCLSVNDTGRGIDEQTRQKIFDPFFTTKQPGEGTGLGLATVYGIVRQNDGLIDVYSTPGQGSRFTIYLPRTADDPAQTRPESTSEALPRGSETVLLAEDEQSVRRLAEEMLEGLGYRVLSAHSQRHLQELVENYREPIDLLLTDVVMPEVNGLELSRQLQQRHPEMKVLFMSGYTANIIAQHGILEEGIELIEKPFTLQQLALKLRSLLD